MHDDGTIEHRRVGYDHVRVPVALRARFGDAAWVDVIEKRFETATLEDSVSRASQERALTPSPARPQSSASRSRSRASCCTAAARCA